MHVQRANNSICYTLLHVQRALHMCMHKPLYGSFFFVRSFFFVKIFCDFEIENIFVVFENLGAAQVRSGVEPKAERSGGPELPPGSQKQKDNF